MACGVGTATVVQICKEYEGYSGLLSSPEKRYTASRVQIVLDNFNIEAICNSMAGRSIPHLTTCLVFLKIRIYFKMDVLLYKVVRPS